MKIAELLIFFAVFYLPFLGKTKDKTVVLEAESFQNTGGWVIDQQSIDQIGSSYLLAHGLGVPCEDAVTHTDFSNSGLYHIWVRTRNWAPAPKKEQSPGRFQVLVNGQPLDTIFGQDKTAWSWYYGGAVNPLRQTHPIRPMPYRCFYSRNIENLFMAGRCASMTHIAQGMFRVQYTTGMMGEVVGIAASLCNEFNCTPRELYSTHLDELLAAFEEGVPTNK